MKFNDEISWFKEQDKTLCSTFGDAYIGTESSWENISRGLNTAEKLISIFGDVP